MKCSETELFGNRMQMPGPLLRIRNKMMKDVPEFVLLVGNEDAVKSNCQNHCIMPNTLKTAEPSPFSRQILWYVN